MKSKMKSQTSKKSYYCSSYIKLNLLLYLMIIHFCCISANTFKRNLDNTGSIIYLVMEGSGPQNFLSGGFTPVPSLVFVNGTKQEATHQCNLEQGENHVILVFEGSLSSCERMFENCGSIKEIDVSK